MTSIVALYKSSEVSEGQKKYFWEKVNEILSQSSDKKMLVLKSLNYVWRCYDTGGISMGRSLRSLLLDRLIKDVTVDDMEHAKRIIAVMIAMYHDHRYIERSGWYDYKLDFGLYGSSLDERINLSVVAFVLGSENKIPIISNFTKEDFHSFLK